MSAREHVRGHITDRGAVVNVHPLPGHRRVSTAKARETHLAFGQKLHSRGAVRHPGERETVGSLADAFWPKGYWP